MCRVSRVFVCLLVAAAGTTITLAQPGPFTTLRNSNLVFAATTLLTNGLPDLTGPPTKLMVSSVATNSAQGGRVSLVVTQAWVKRFNGLASSEDQGTRVVADSDGNIVVAGYSLGLGTGADFITIKYRPDGTATWTNRYDGPDHGRDRIWLIALDGANNIYVSGESINSAGGMELATVKYSTDGDPVWTNRFTGSGGGFIFPVDLVVDAAGNAYLSPFDFDNPAYITVKYDTAGNQAWINYFHASASSMDNPSGIAVDGTGNVFVTGGSSDPGGNFVTLKYAADGTSLWTNHYSLVNLESADGITVDRQGNLIVIGSSQGGTPDQKYITLKYSNDGVALWTNVMAGPGYVGGGVPTIVLDASDNVFFTGGSVNGNGSAADFTTVKFSSGGAVLWTNRFIYPSAVGPFLDGTAVDSAGNFYLACDATPLGGANYDYATFKCSANGTAVWTNRYNGPANASDNPRDIATDLNGAVYVTGASSGSGSGFGALDFATVKYANNLRYTPPTNFIGTDTFTFTAVNDAGNSATGLVTVAVLPPTLQFNTAGLQFTTEGLRLQVDGARGTNPVAIYASTNLVNWNPIFTNPPTLGSVQFLDSAAANFERRYYRAVQP